MADSADGASKKKAGKQSARSRSLIGQTIGGCRIEKKLGQGGMGAVFRAHHEALDIPVAVKVMPPSFARQNRDNVNRFLLEARSAARLKHQNIVGVLNVGQEKGLYYIVMDFVEGESLQARLRDEFPMPVDDAVHILTQICEALELARENGVVHRDIKPDNIMIDRKGVAKLADLGLAKSLEEDHGMTQSGVAMGTPHYMSPEQADDAKTADHRSDIYSLGCTFYRMVCAKVPYEGSSLYQILDQHVNAAVPDPQEANPEIPDEVAAVLRRMMAKSREDRYQTAADVLQALSLRPKPATKSARKSSRRTSPPGPERSSHRKAAAAVGGVLLIGAIAVGLLHPAWREEPEPTPSPKEVVEPSPEPAPTPKEAPASKEPPEPAPEPEGWQEFLSAAEEAHEAEDFGRAISYYEQALAGMDQDEESSEDILKPSREVAEQGLQESKVAQVDQQWEQEKEEWLAKRDRLPPEAQVVLIRQKLTELHFGNSEVIGGLGLGEQGVGKFRTGPGLRTLAPLEGLPLTHVHLYRSQAVEDLTPLQGMPLRFLRIGKTQVEDLTPLRDMPLETMDFSLREIKKGMEVLRGLDSLRELTVVTSKHYPLKVDEFWKAYEAGSWTNRLLKRPYEDQEFFEGRFTSPGFSFELKSGGRLSGDFKGEWHAFRSDQVALWFEGGSRGILTWRGDETWNLHMNGENILFERE